MIGLLGLNALFRSTDFRSETAARWLVSICKHQVACGLFVLFLLPSNYNKSHYSDNVIFMPNQNSLPCFKRNSGAIQLDGDAVKSLK